MIEVAVFGLAFLIVWYGASLRIRLDTITNILDGMIDRFLMKETLEREQRDDATPSTRTPPDQKDT